MSVNCRVDFSDTCEKHWKNWIFSKKAFFTNSFEYLLFKLEYYQVHKIVAQENLSFSRKLFFYNHLLWPYTDRNMAAGYSALYVFIASSCVDCKKITRNAVFTDSFEYLLLKLEHSQVHKKKRFLLEQRI